MQNVTFTRNNKTARITQIAVDAYKVVITLASDISSYGDVLIARTFVSPRAAMLFAERETA